MCGVIFKKQVESALFSPHLADDKQICVKGTRGSTDASLPLSEYSGHINSSSVSHSPFFSLCCPPGLCSKTANFTKMLTVFFPLSKSVNLFHFWDWSKSSSQPNSKEHSHSVYSGQHIDLQCTSCKK